MLPTMYPYLSYRDAATALSFLQEAFGFPVGVRWDHSEGTVQHAEATFGEGAVMIVRQGSREASAHAGAREGRALTGRVHYPRPENRRRGTARLS